MVNVLILDWKSSTLNPYHPSKVALVEQLLTEVWSGPGTVLLNPEFPAAAVPEPYRHVSESVLVTWSFLPLMVSVS